MRKYYKIPLAFLALAAGIGLFLRWQFVVPTAGIRYTYFLHAHSHVMFLGWVFNVLFLAFTQFLLPETRRRRYLRFFLFLQIPVAAMMISFPIQGYGLYSIIFSTVHTLAVMIFIPVFFQDTRKDKRISVWFARIAWLFFFISTAGPFSLGYLMANGMGQSVWYNVSIYYYLHFQYNGFFTFGVFSLLFEWIERRQIPFRVDLARRFGGWMAFACLPAFALSVLFAKPPVVLNVIGAIAAVIQLIALLFLLRILWNIRHPLMEELDPYVRRLLVLAGTAFAMKCLIQLVSAEPTIAVMAYSMRPVVIAYLHLVLVGVIALFLLAWLFQQRLLRPDPAKAGVAALLVGFAGSELCLVFSPWWPGIAGVSMAIWIFGLSVLMWVGIVAILLAFNKHALPSPAMATTDKNQERL